MAFIELPFRPPAPRRRGLNGHIPGSLSRWTAHRCRGKRRKSRHRQSVSDRGNGPKSRYRPWPATFRRTVRPSVTGRQHRPSARRSLPGPGKPAPRLGVQWCWRCGVVCRMAQPMRSMVPSQPVRMSAKLPIAGTDPGERHLITDVPAIVHDRTTRRGNCHAEAAAVHDRHQSGPRRSR